MHTHPFHKTNDYTIVRLLTIPCDRHFRKYVTCINVPNTSKTYYILGDIYFICINNVTSTPGHVLTTSLLRPKKIKDVVRTWYGLVGRGRNVVRT